jgi:multidrug resistance efflux pump
MNPENNQMENKIKPAPAKKSILKRIAGSKIARIIGIVILLALAVIGAVILKQLNSRVYTDQADIEAPTITLGPSTPGILQKLFVNVGDRVAIGTPVAEVGTEIIQTQVAGIITSTDNIIGQIANPTDPVVTMIDPTQLRAVAHLDEDKGLSSVQVGQHATFTVDAFGSTEYQGIVDEISPTAREDDIVFNISDQRQTQEFDVKIRFDTTTYPELSNGMSAKITIYKN